MNTRRLALALCFALLCSGLLTWQLSRHMAHPPVIALAPTQRVVVAARELHAGEALSASSLATMKVPAGMPQLGLFHGPQQVTGRVLLVAVAPGEVLTAHDVAGANAPSGLAAVIPDGMRAIAISVADQAGAPLLIPGSHVDILVSYRSDAEAAFVSSMVVQNILVLGADPRHSAQPRVGLDGENALELLVTPEEVARLTVASSLGKLTFALRNGRDQTLNPGLTQVTLNLTPRPSSAGTPQPTVVRAHLDTAPKGFAVELLAGDKSSTETFPEAQP